MAVKYAQASFLDTPGRVRCNTTTTRNGVLHGTFKIGNTASNNRTLLHTHDATDRKKQHECGRGNAKASWRMYLYEEPAEEEEYQFM